MGQLTALVAVALALVLGPYAHAWAGAPTDALRDTFSTVNRALDDPELRKTPADLRAAIRNALLPLIDSREGARLALGDEWTARTPAERGEFAPLFGDHFERTYVFRIAAHAPMYRALAIRYVDEKIDGRTATVATALGNREGGEVPVEYRLIQRDGRWVVYDVVIDGASLIDGYKTLFSKVMNQSSYPDVVALMKPRPMEMRAAGPSAKASAPPPTTAAVEAPATPSPAPVATTPLATLAAPVTPAPAPAAAPVVAAPPPAAAAAPAPVVAPPAPMPAAAASPAPVEAPLVATPAPAAETSATAMTPPTPKLARLVADHAARANVAANAPAPVPAITYWLQVGAFKNQDAADGLAARLRTRNLPVSIDPVTVPPGPSGTPLSRVRVGPFADRAEAAAKLRELETSGYRPFLVVERTSN